MISVIYLNSRSIINKLNDLEVLLSDYSPDILLISETWCNDDISMAMLNIDGYYIDPDLRKDREDTF